MADTANSGASRSKLSEVAAAIFRAWGGSREDLALVANSHGWTLEELEAAAMRHGVPARYLYENGLGHLPPEVLDEPIDL